MTGPSASRLFIAFSKLAFQELPAVGEYEPAGIEEALHDHVGMFVSPDPNCFMVLTPPDFEACARYRVSI